MTQDEALQILKNGHNVYLTGAAGSGKTYLLNAFIDYLRNNRSQVAVTASTGIAATHLEGITIHSWSGIGILRAASDKQLQDIIDRKRIRQRIRKTQVLIIDEVSMLDGDRFDLLEKVASMSLANGRPLDKAQDRPFGGLQVVLCGDLFQLPPVAGANEPRPTPIYESEAWKKLDLRVCYLHEQHRQGDQEFLGILNAIRGASVDAAVVTRLRQCRNTILPATSAGRFVRLYSHNSNVDSENDRELANLEGKGFRYVMRLGGVPAVAEALKGGCLAPEKLVLKKGAAVMFVKNNFEKGYVNGTLGRVSGFDDKGLPVVALFNGKEVVAEPETWKVDDNGRTLAEATQIPLRLAWAITVHKSQGMTLDAAQVDLSQCFEKGMGYVALSRVRSLAGLRLLAFNDMALRVSEETLAFDGDLRKSSDAALRELAATAKPAAAQVEVTKQYSLAKIRERLPSAFKRWTADEETKLTEGFHSGKSEAELAMTHGRGVGGVRSRLMRLGLIKPAQATETPHT